jgi:hypothetical protein
MYKILLHENKLLRESNEKLQCQLRICMSCQKEPVVVEEEPVVLDEKPVVVEEEEFNEKPVLVEEEVIMEPVVMDKPVFVEKLSVRYKCRNCNYKFNCLYCKLLSST